MKLSYNKKAKCQGCCALLFDGGVFSCSLGLEVFTVMVGGTNIQPTPKNKCYKPKTSQELRKVKELLLTKINA